LGSEKKRLWSKETKGRTDSPLLTAGSGDDKIAFIRVSADRAKETVLNVESG
jgi:hypothetical protein